MRRLVGPILRGEADFVIGVAHPRGREPGSMGRHQVLAGWVDRRWHPRCSTGTRYSDMCAFRAIRTRRARATLACAR